MSGEKENRSTTHPPEVYVGLICLEIKLTFEAGDPVQLVYDGIQRVTGDGRAPYRAFSIRRVEKQPVNVSRRVSVGVGG